MVTTGDVIDDFELPDQKGEPRRLSELVADGLTHLVAEYREALVLRFQEGLSLEEIAVITGAPLGTVKSRIYRGLSALQPYLKGAQA